MEENLILLESKEKREELISHLEVLDKVKEISFLTNDLVVTTEQVANYFEVETDTIKKVVSRNKEELENNGLKTIRGQELKEFKNAIGKGQDVPNLKFASQLTLFTKRTILNIGMLLTESLIAEKIREYLLNIEDNSSEEQKVEAVKKVVTDTLHMTDEELANHYSIKLLNKKLREEKSLVTIQSAIDRLQLYGVSLAEASYIIQKAIVDKVNVNKAILKKIEEIKLLETNINRGIIREKISYVAKYYFDDDYETVYHTLSDKMRYMIGFNMRAHRDRLKAKNAKAERGQKVDVPSYLDMIVEYNAYEEAAEAINDIMDEKENFKALAIESRAKTQKENNNAKKEAKIEAKEADTNPKKEKSEVLTF